MKILQKSLRSVVDNPKHIFKLTIQGIFVGVFAGIIVCLYRFFLYSAEDILRNILNFIHGNIVLIVLWFFILIILGLFTSFLIKWEPNSIGSGIPQINAEVKGFLNVNWWKVVITKISGGILTAIGGLSLGPEGPSVQIGGMIGKGVSKILRGSKTDELRLILAGSTVGITAAFNAPLAGVIFIIEEINHSFDKTLIFIALISSVVADVISKSIFGQATLLSFPLYNLPLSYYWLLIILGIILGIFGYVYNVGMIKANDIINNFNVSIEIKIISVFLISGVVSLFIPEILDGGHFMLNMLDVAIPSITILIFLLVMKYLFSVASFATGSPGGIFLPILVLGAFIGAIFGSVAIPIFGLKSYLIYKFIVISMAGFFAATIRSPITGVVLLSEMCGSTESLVAMLIVSIIAYSVPMLLNNRPIYESLFERLISKNNQDLINDHSKHILSEYVVPSTWKYIGKQIKDIPFPKNCIVISITRNGKYILSNENVIINYADQIHILMDSNNYPFENDEMNKLMDEVV
ncbi:ClC family H(+)/Cl(-) exchange transporter [uncultured Methanobrevibacter sp.]|uniref:ClC family H(+)/Cl(-) exchange transporter n=1 Tax=uncultured Methanobrevibacter sp. TaxID=253161 RepID=UPI00260BBE91|nr:ClC family H(+)/Cl(-) exchange transporter [uncultured Methanobrevibacter sp.]